jgi:hypothetical protein
MSNWKMSRKTVKPLGDALSVRARLYLLGWPSVAQWANNHGYAEGTVREVLRRWSHKKCEPLGGVSRDIMRDIRKTLQDEITPEMAEAV